GRPVIHTDMKNGTDMKNAGISRPPASLPSENAHLMQIAAVSPDMFTPLEVAPFKAFYQHLGSGYIGGKRNVVHIAEPQQRIHFRLVAPPFHRVSQEHHHVDLVERYPRSYLLRSSKQAGRYAVHLQSCTFCNERRSCPRGVKGMFLQYG